MSLAKNAQITAIGSYVPGQPVPNTYFESFLETQDTWIQTRTGIQTRHFAAEDEFTIDLAEKAAQNLNATYTGELSDVDFIILASISSEQTMPSVASQLQDRLAIRHAGTIDITAACAGFAYGLILARGLIAAGSHRKVLVIGVETISKVLDFSDRSTSILFGDGAGAVLVEPAQQAGIFAIRTGTFGDGGADLYLSHLNPRLNGASIIPNGKIHQNGRKVFKWAVQTIAREIQALLSEHELDLQAIDWLVPHSANLRIIEAICKQLDYPVAQVLQSVATYGNTSAASIPLAMDLGFQADLLQRGDKLLLIGFGGGLTYAGAVIEWDI